MTEGMSLIVRSTGEVVNLEDPEDCIRFLVRVREAESEMREAKGAVTEALRYEFSRQGKKTLEFENLKLKAVLGPDEETVWDIEVLDELRDLGLPEERMDELISTEISYKVNASVAKQIAGANPSYASVIERAKSKIPKTAYVSVKRG